MFVLPRPFNRWRQIRHTFPSPRCRFNQQVMRIRKRTRDLLHHVELLLTEFILWQRLRKGTIWHKVMRHRIQIKRLWGLHWLERTPRNVFVFKERNIGNGISLRATGYRPRWACTQRFAESKSAIPVFNVAAQIDNFRQNFQRQLLNLFVQPPVDQMRQLRVIQRPMARVGWWQHNLQMTTQRPKVIAPCCGQHNRR